MPCDQSDATDTQRDCQVATGLGGRIDVLTEIGRKIGARDWRKRLDQHERIGLSDIERFLEDSYPHLVADPHRGQGGGEISDVGNVHYLVSARS